MKKIFVMALLIAAVMLPVIAQETQLTVSQAVEKALSNSSEAVTAYNTLQKALNSSKTTSLIPSLSLDSNIRENINYLDLSSTKSPTVSFSGGLAWNLKTSSIYEKIANSLSLENSELTYQSSLNSISCSTIKSYWNLVSLNNKVTAAQNSFSTALQNFSRIYELYNVSKATELSLSQAKLSLSQSSISLKDAESSFADAKKEFAETLGLNYIDFVLEELPDLSNLDISKIQETAKANLQNSVSWKKADLSLEITKNSAESTKWQSILPSVNFSLNATASSDVSNNEFTFGTTGNVSISIPLDSYIPGTSGYAKKKNAGLDLDSAEINYEQTTENLVNSLESALTTIEDKLSLITFLNEYKDLSEKNLEQVSKAFEEGYASYSDYSSAVSTYINACSSSDDNTIQIINSLCTLSGLTDVDVQKYMELTK